MSLSGIRDLQAMKRLPKRPRTESMSVSLLIAPEFREIEDDYRAVVESASEAICITQDGVLKFVNPAGTQLTGYSREELLSRPFAALTHPEDLEELVRIYMMRLRGEYVAPGHRFRIITKAGALKWVESWSASIDVEWTTGGPVHDSGRDRAGPRGGGSSVCPS